MVNPELTKIEQISTSSINREVGPLHLALQTLVESRNVVLHGSATTNIQALNPVRAMGVDEDQALSAVYATDSAPEAIFFAILNRANVGSFSSETYGTDYGVDTFGASSPWQTGTVYILPRDTFKKVGGYWVSEAPVTPIGAIAVQPNDFPYLGQVQKNKLPWYMKWIFKIVRFWYSKVR